MSEQLVRETRKLEVRLDEFLKENEEFVRWVRDCLEKLKELSSSMGEMKETLDAAKLQELRTRRLATTKALAEALRLEGRMEHERSHLMESYGALLLAIGGESQ